jgi:membrane protein YqaA with SNARE-associated domain
MTAHGGSEAAARKGEAISKGRRMVVLRIAALVFVVALSVTLYIYRDQVQKLQVLGYPGIFLVALLSNATIVLPAPGLLFTSVMGAVFHPVGVALAAASGATLGEMSGFLAGFSGQSVAERTPIYERVEGWMRRYGQWAVLVLAFLPLPVFDIAGVIAGILKMPVWRFLVFCWIGKLGKMMIVAYGGASLFAIFER